MSHEILGNFLFFWSNTQFSVLSMPPQSAPSGFKLQRQDSWTKEPTRKSLGEAIIEWLKLRPDPPLDAHKRHSSLCQQRGPETGSWILADEKLQNWRNTAGPPQCLWMRGIMGCGKTILVSRIVDELAQDPSDIGYAYLYFQEEDECQASFSCIWTTLFMQLLDNSDSTIIAAGVKKMFNRPPRGSTPFNPPDYFELFRDQAATFKSVYLIFDGIDSFCKVHDTETWTEMFNTLKRLPDNVKVLFTSRSEWFEPKLSEAEKIDIEPRRDDVRAYVEHRIESDKTLQDLLSIDQSQPTVVDQVIRMTLDSGMFLLAKLHMNELTSSKQINLDGIHSALKRLPKTAESVFEAAVQHIIRKDGIEDRQTRLAGHVLSWILHAKAEMTVDQIREGFAVRESKDHRYQSHMPTKNALLSVCAGLVIIDTDKKTLRLVHNSIKTHLQEHRLIQPNTDLIMAKTCIRCMLLIESNEKKDSSLLHYAVRHWSAHLASARQSMDRDDDKLVMKLLRNSYQLTRAFKTLPEPLDCSSDNMTGFHASVYYNLRDWLQPLVDAGENVNAQSADGQTALHWAVRHGRCEMIPLLIDNSADPNITDNTGNSPLHQALLNPIAESSAIVQALVNGGGKPNMKGARGLTPLSAAIRSGPTSIAEILIKSQPDIDAETVEDWNLLREVVHHGRDIINMLEQDAVMANPSDTDRLAELRETAESHGRQLMDLLLDKGVDLNRPTSVQRWTPLIYAVTNADISKMRRFLGRQHNPADANLRGFKEGYSPLRWALYYPNTEAVELLIEHGADINEIYDDGWSPLVEAVRKKKNDMVRLLIDKGANLNTSNSGSTPLIEAVKVGNSDAVWLLLQSQMKVFLDERDDSGMSALLYALQSGNKGIVWLLVSKGASLNDQTKNTSSAINFALRHGKINDNRKADFSLVWLLLQNGADINAADSRGMTPLHHVSSSGSLEALQFLIEHNVHVDVPDDKGHTPLALAVLKERDQAVQFLVQYRASLFVRNQDGLTPLHHAAVQGFNSGLKILLLRSEALDVVDNRSYTALHHAVNSKSSNEETIHLLVTAGAGLEIEESHKQTPLMLAAQLGREPIVRQLLIEGADVFKKNEYGHSAISYTRGYGKSHDGVRSILKRANRGMQI
ncbi:Putative NACHT nucleoside triphosphatase, P-loop containing nucleoside triphosphate hydrolase [Colletotrichum destructivum]|uniref:NACHT nucleoside triphosphatase, P-loop containing nucleoside triphosphate hydrolase n=1 Tax=Colletotrichum destructivum TaxID=34406 RepID=A0AAX4J3Z9_9PEZI|nr:Putative NACHT nucleoside triphosphatase, P-loop containing nucleoside triphosphate hydrolase [Colletotrichum destructivum]